MIAGFFYDERFTRDAAGTYYSSTGSLPYAVFERYLKHFDRIVVVGRYAEQRERRTVASGAGVEFACIDASRLGRTRLITAVARHVRETLARVDCAIIRLPGLLGPLACREAIRSRTPWMAEVVGNAFDSLWNFGSWKGKVAAVPMQLLNRHAIRRARFAIYVTQQFLQRTYPPSGMWAGVSDVLIDAPEADTLRRRIARIEAGSARAAAVLGLIGSYDVNYKGHETALRALAQLARSGRAVTLRCIGVGDAGRWRARAAALGVHRFVEFGGALPQGRRVLDWMDGLDVYLAPSLQEGLPRALVEAMSRALPAIGSLRGGIPELLERRWLHRAGDHRALAGLAAALLDDREEMKAQALRNWRVASEYAPDVLDARREGLVEQFKEAAIANARGQAARAFAQ